MIQQQLAYSIRKEVAECLAETKGWVTNSAATVNPIDYQCSTDKYTKILYVENSGLKVSIHCLCRYAWKKTERWQYGYSPDSYIQILQKHVRAGCDYLAIVNRHFNQLILIPREELIKASTVSSPILNKINGKIKIETLYLVPYYGNNNLEYFSRQYGSDISNWSRKNLDGSSLG